MYYRDNGCWGGNCNNPNQSSGWGALFAAGVGAVGGYLLARNNNLANGGTCGTCNGSQTPFQQGEYTGENRAGINYIAQTVNANSKAIAELGTTLANRKIAEQADEIQALKTQQIVQNVGCVTNGQLAQVNHTLNSIVTGCGVKSYPGCCGC
jgi:hypothetical protein